MVPQGLAQRCTNSFGSPGSLLLKVCVGELCYFAVLSCFHTDCCAAQGVAGSLSAGELADCRWFLQSAVGCGLESKSSGGKDFPRGRTAGDAHKT